MTIDDTLSDFCQTEFSCKEVKDLMQKLLFDMTEGGNRWNYEDLEGYFDYIWEVLENEGYSPKQVKKLAKLEDRIFWIDKNNSVLAELESHF